MRRKAIWFVLGVFASLVFANPVMADDLGQVQRAATVTVTQFVEVTLTDRGTEGLSFGDLAPGTLKAPEVNSPSVTVSVSASSNANVQLEIMGTDFSEGNTHSFFANNAFWSTTDDSSEANEMITSYSVVGTVAPDSSIDVYHWLTIPPEQQAAPYTSDFTYRTSMSTPVA